MLFNSLHYMVFLPLAVAVYFLLPHRHRWKFLLAASYYFYMCWKVEYILLIVASTLVDYWAGLKMGAKEDKKDRKPWLILSIAVNLGLLFAFKYFNFANESLRALFNSFNVFYGVPYFHVLLPVGISFYTFQTLSYSMSVYRGVQAPERHLGIFALYVSFFPQLVAGPIERSTNLLPQFYQKHNFTYENTVSGLRLILWGMFKKVVIADRVGVLVAQVFGSPQEYNGVAYMVALFFFAYQVFCDFSGYSDIAIGTARIFGVKLMLNFNRPFYSKTMGEFWHRWHISLSSWFRDYFYIAIGGSRVSKPRWYFNVYATFLISGLWHGASWNFVFWGSVHGVFIVAEMLTKDLRAWVMRTLGITTRNWLYRIQGVIYCMSVFSFAHLFFRTRDLRDAMYMVMHLFSGIGDFLMRMMQGDWVVLRINLRGLGMTQKEMLIALLAIAVLEAVHFSQRTRPISLRLAEMPVAVRWAVYYGLVGAIIFFGAYNQSAQFIYFQF
jgi:alginate O-acetyltransferase complex protein AlgI